ncbi:protein phosphatase 2C family protein [Actinidia rufa]|nr:protein phosphatase 2C family protein [Actinidia rufa]
MSVEVIRKAFQATEEGFLSLVTKQWPIKPQIAAVGSCCLVGVICNGTLYIANLGDSRAVMGRLVKATGDVLAMQLSEEHNAAIESVRRELHSLHPDDSQIVVLKHNVWRVKGLIQVRLLRKKGLGASYKYGVQTFLFPIFFVVAIC